MVARDVVHREFSGSPAESTQIRTAQGCRAQMAASLALFFSRSRHLVQRSPIEPFTMQDHGSRLSSSMNQISFFSWIFFDPLISGYFLFLLIPSRLGNVETAAAKWDPHVILYEQSTFFSWSFFGTSYLVTCLFLSIPCRLSNGDTAAANWDPHVILYVI